MAKAHLCMVFNVIGFRLGVMHGTLHHATRSTAAAAAAASAVIMNISF